jgi:hypothetical protein
MNQLIKTTYMNKLMNVPNKIKQPPQCCNYCGKIYKTRANLDKHINLCELIVEAMILTIINSLSVKQPNKNTASESFFWQIILNYITLIFKCNKRNYLTMNTWNPYTNKIRLYNYLRPSS